MKTPLQKKPPKWATRLLNWYCRAELVEDLEGDLNEFFERNVKSKGLYKAKIIYIIDVLKFLRPYTLQKPNFLTLLLHWIMLNNYIKISGRVIFRNRLFSSINIVGLGVSMAVGLLLITLLNDMSKYDKFHEHHERIYRVVSKYKYMEREDPDFYASTSLRTGEAIKEFIPRVEKVAVLKRGFEGDIANGEKVIPLSGFWANDHFLKVFSFSLVSGDPKTALTNPYTVVLTESAAKKLFGDTNALGKTIVNPNMKADTEFLVTGILKDVPSFSHVKFDMLASLSTRIIMEKENKNEMAWENMWDAYTYLLLSEGTDVNDLQDQLTNLANKENQLVENTTINLFLQPLTNIALGEDMNNANGPTMGSSSVWMMGVLSLIVILSACFNYTNLSIARSLRRSREVGIRKVVGALRTHVFSQFVVEAVMLSLFALLFSLTLFVLLKPYFLSLDDQYKRMLVLDISPAVIVYFVLFAVGVGIAAGLFPALFFARVNTIQVLKNISSVRVFRNITTRKALIVVQFTLSLMFIAATISGYKHYKNILAFDLGFKTENILNIRLYGNKADVLKKRLLEMPEVKGISTSMIITSIGHYYGTRMKYNDPHDSAGVYYNIVDENYIPLHGHKLLAGRNFKATAENAIESEVIVNEKVLKRFDITDQNPAKAIGEIVTVDKKKMQIIGVMKDYHYGRSTDKEIKEVIFRYAPSKAGYINANVVSTDWPATLSKIESAWKEIDNVHPLNATFYDEQITQAYSSFSSRIKLIGSLAFLAICIASIGLLGMVVFTTETRLKEISIRKVLGATERSLVYLLSRSFLLLLILAAFIALPVTHFFFFEYVLPEYADDAPFAWSELLIGVMAVIGISLLMIGSHTLKVSRSNPADVLKGE